MSATPYQENGPDYPEGDLPYDPSTGELPSSDCSETWYLLYGGSSEDGRGQGRYVGRTTDPEKALEHFNDVNYDPYSTGRVLIITDDKEKVAREPDDFPEQNSPNEPPERLAP